MAQHSIRFPDDLEAQIQERAERNRRSFSQTALLLIEAGLQASRPAPPAPAVIADTARKPPEGYTLPRIAPRQ